MNFMSVLNPEKADYQTPDGLEVAKDIAWVMRTLWGGAVVFAVAVAWGVSLAHDVKGNTEQLDKAATAAQVEQVLAQLVAIKKGLSEADQRQREIKSELDKLGSKVDSIEKRDESP